MEAHSPNVTAMRSALGRVSSDGGEQSDGEGSTPRTPMSPLARAVALAQAGLPCTGGGSIGGLRLQDTRRASDASDAATDCRGGGEGARSRASAMGSPRASVEEQEQELRGGGSEADMAEARCVCCSVLCGCAWLALLLYTHTCRSMMCGTMRRQAMRSFYDAPNSEEEAAEDLQCAPLFGFCFLCSFCLRAALRNYLDKPFLPRDRQDSRVKKLTKPAGCLQHRID